MRTLIIILITALTVCSLQLTQPLGKATRQLGPTLFSAQISQISVNETQIYPASLLQNSNSCLEPSLTTIAAGQELIIKSIRPFVVFLTTEFARRYFDLEQSGLPQEDLSMNAIVNSVKEGLYYVARVSVQLKCRYSSHSYFQIKALIEADFYEDGKADKKELNFLLVCATHEQIQSFQRIYIPGYIIFWLYFNLSLMIYHNYFRDRYHYVMFAIYFVGSLLIQDSLLAYIYSGGIFLLVVMRQKRQNTISNKAFSLYIVFILLFVLLIIYTYKADNSNHFLSGFWIALDNFVTIHISMFLVLRLIKLHRFRQVFWYFLAVSILCLVLEEQSNKFFQLHFKNPLNRSCLRSNIFFGIMMLPISNFYTSITKWMHRVVSVSLVLSSVIPLGWGIKLMAGTLFVILLGEIKSKNVGVIRHMA